MTNNNSKPTPTPVGVIIIYIMKEVVLNNGFASENRSDIAIEVANILGKNNDNDFQQDGENIIEYQAEDSITCHIDSIKHNLDGCIYSVNIEC